MDPTTHIDVNGMPVPVTVKQTPVHVSPLIPWWEWAAVGVVGLMLGGTARVIGAKGALSGAALYLLGYWVRNRRPAAGYAMPSPMMAAFRGERPAPAIASQPHVIDAE